MKRVRRLLTVLFLITAFTLSLTACGATGRFNTFREQLTAENFKLVISIGESSVEIEIDGKISYYPEGQPTGGDATMYYVQDMGETIQQYYRNEEIWTVEEVASPNRIKGLSEAISAKDNYIADGDVFRMPDGIIEDFTDCTLQFKDESVVFSFTYQNESKITFEFSEFGKMDLTLPEIS